MTLTVLLFWIYSKQDAPFHSVAYNYSCADWDGLYNHLRDVPWEDIFKFSASAAASKFCEWIQVKIDVYIPHCKYQAKLHSSPWFSAACVSAIVHGNHFFHLQQHNKSSGSKSKVTQASTHCKRVLEAAKLTYATKTKECITSQQLGSQDFGKLLIVFSTRVNLLYPLYSNYLWKAFLITLILMTLSVFPSRTNLKLHISITPKMVKKVIMSLDSSKASGRDCIPVVVLSK